MSLEEQFQQAVINSKTLSEKPDNETLLKMYALYKQGSEGDNLGEAPTNPFDFVAKAKFSAWDSLKNTTKEAAMQQYIDLVKELKKS